MNSRTRTTEPARQAEAGRRLHGLGGVWAALPTPFSSSGGLDLEGFRRVVQFVLAGGVEVLVPLGTTGEAVALEDDERDAVVRACLEAAGGRPVVVGCGHPATHVAARMVQRARSLGADGALVVTPYYNKPTQDGLVAHYRALASAAPGFPLVAYSVPGRTGVALGLGALEQLWQLDELVALKEAGGDVARYREIARAMPGGKTLLAGDDHLIVDGVGAGARGVVSVVANASPEATCHVLRAALAGHETGDDAEARRSAQRLAPLVRALFLESNPIPLKAALEILGLAGPHLRLPLTRATEPTLAALRAALAHLHEPAETQT